MAYYLAAGDSASGDYVSIPDTNLTGDFTVEFEMPFDGSQNWRPFGRIGDFNSRAFKSGGTNNFQVGSTSLQVIVISGVTYTNRNIYTLIRSGSTLSLEVNGVPQGSVIDSGTFNFNAIFTQNSFAQSRGASDLYRFRIWSDATKTNLVRDYDPAASIGQGKLVDKVNANNGNPVNFPENFDDALIYYDDGSEPEPELHEFSGNAIVSALSFAQISKITQHNGQALITASATASSTKVINVSGGVTVVAQSVSLFEKLNTFNGAASVIATSQSSASKLVPFNGQATVSVTATASIIDGDVEIHSFSGCALITASASGQAVKIGLVSGSVNINASISAQASKTALLNGNATVSTSTQSLLSKIANITGNAITRVTTLAAVLKRVTLSGASRVVATASGTFFNTESNVETYELTVQGRVKAPSVVQGTVKSLTIQGRIK